MKKTFTLFAIVLFYNTAFATVHYTYVGDNIYNSGDFYYYDLDGDGDDDFSIGREDNNYHFVVNSLKNTSLFAADASHKPKAYTQGAGMGTYQWETSNNSNRILVENNGSAGLFKDVSKYLMVKFNNINGQTFYGWFYLEGETGHLRVISHAYEDISGQSIIPGQTTTGIGEVKPTVSFVSVVNSNGISFKSTNEFDNVKIYDVTGRTLTEISEPVANQNYGLEIRSNAVVVVFFSRGELLGTSKHLIQ